MNELVYLKNDEAVCDSLQVAEKFGKRHDKLIAEINKFVWRVDRKKRRPKWWSEIFLRINLRESWKTISYVFNDERWLFVVGNGFYRERSS